ncbi:DUF177 domain-containing protein [Novosphingobium sp. 1949]|uniref:DUF177 domain-containing protein n=1 Tax=Novosphingobium organovorum TaxID=2930092 RepID=A0ABT0BFP4_9SPHN|nr:DUF177 domain-containing protein [Novosphingobium organovorum]MCJ2183849.1 DUF177 domain-containing protein [Novosphingobium organovorum]
MSASEPAAPAASPEFSRLIDVRQVEGLSPTLEANAAERAALARRFGLVRIDTLTARLDLSRKDRTVFVSGTLEASWVQTCAISADELPVSVREPVEVRFVPQLTDYAPDAEIELEADDLDEIEYTGTHVDLGEAVAQSMALAIDPYLTGPNAEKARSEAGLTAPEDNSPFAALKGLKPGG